MIDDFIALLFPKVCTLCQSPLSYNEDLICVKCQHEFPRTDFHLDTSNSLCQKLDGRISVRYALAYLNFRKKGISQNLIHKLKYLQRGEIAELLGKWYGQELYSSGFSEKFDLIVAVPLHKKKKKQRGFNQSDLFAKGLSETLKVEYSTKMLSRTINSQSQTKKDRTGRWKNVENIFELTNSADFHRKSVLLVDDVFTTGATIEACANVIKVQDRVELSIAVLAMAE